MPSILVFCTTPAFSLLDKAVDRSSTAEDDVKDPMVVCTAFGKKRFYVFGKHRGGEGEERDVFNEPPDADDVMAAEGMRGGGERLGNEVRSTGGTRIPPPPSSGFMPSNAAFL